MRAPVESSCTSPHASRPPAAVRSAVFLWAVLFAAACRGGAAPGAPSEGLPGAPSAAAPREAGQAAVMVFAAASLTEVVTDIAAAFEASRGVTVTLNLASSGTLARQMQEGAAPDLFISASRRWADYVEARGLTKSEHRREIARNALVLIAPADSPLDPFAMERTIDWGEFLGQGRLSVGDPAHVPAGRYAAQSLERLGWSDRLQDKTLPAKDVRSALMVVELGEAPAGIVYRTDAERSTRVKILSVFPETSHDPISYIATACRTSAAALGFLDYLSRPETDATWQRYGFRR